MAVKPAPQLATITADDESDLMLVGFCVFADEPKPAARQSLAQLAELGIEVKIATGDNPRVAEKVCADLGLVSKGTITGAEMEHFGDEEFAHAAQNYSIFARISPEQKARLITAARRTGRSVGFLGDGVNDALALHAADVGISVDTATDVAKDAADVVLLEKDLGVLATGVATGRRIFANTIKYVFMGTSSNFGNTFSAAAASAFLPFLPMLPSQILLGNLLYDASQLAIPTDRVDEEQRDAPSHWNVAFIRRFMLTFGPINSLFDFLTFGFMLGILHAGEVAFHTGWFLENLLTQTFIVFAIRTRRVPFLRSRPGALLTVTLMSVDVIGFVLTVTPLGRKLGFVPLPWQFYAALAVFIVTYLVLVEAAKKVFYSEPMRVFGQPYRTRGLSHLIERRAARFTHSAPPRQRTADGRFITHECKTSVLGNVNTVITRRGLPGLGLLAAPLRAAAASTRMAVTASAVVAGAAASTALLGGSVAASVGRSLARATPDVSALTRAAAGVAIEAIGGPPARRNSSNGPRRWIEVRGLDGEHASAIAADVLAAVRATPGVRQAFLNRTLARLVVTVDTDAATDPRRQSSAGSSPTPNDATERAPRDSTRTACRATTRC